MHHFLTIYCCVAVTLILLGVIRINIQLHKIMANLDQVLQDVTDESTTIDGLSTFITGLEQQLADALSGATLPPGVQAKVDAVFNQAEANKAKLAAALAANVPPAPVPPAP